jgi:hypothetical protein
MRPAVPYFRTSDVHLRYGSADRFGILLEGSHLTVTELVWIVRWHLRDSPNVPNMPNVSRMPNVPNVVQLEATLQVGKLSGIHADIRLDYLDYRAWSVFNKNSFCISCGAYDHTQAEFKRSSGWTPTMLILLRPMPEYGVGAFRRIGLATRLRDPNEYLYGSSASITFSDFDDASEIPSVEYRPDTREHVIKIF